MFENGVRDAPCLNDYHASGAEHWSECAESKRRLVPGFVGTGSTTPRSRSSTSAPDLCHHPGAWVGIHAHGWLPAVSPLYVARGFLVRSVGLLTILRAAPVPSLELRPSQKECR